MIQPYLAPFPYRLQNVWETVESEGYGESVSEAD